MTVTGRDERFRRLYAEEAVHRLSRLSSGALELESARGGGPVDAELVDAMFRDAHSLKGGAAVVGLDEASRVAHALEDVLEALRSGIKAPTAGLVDALLEAVDAFPALLDGADGAGIVARLVAALDEPQERVVALPEVWRGSAVPAVPRRDPEPDIVRVPRRRLDALSRLAEASAAAQQRLARALADRADVDAGQIGEFRQLAQLLGELQEQAVRTRMVPVASVLEPVRRTVRDLARAVGKHARWELRGGETELDRGVLEQLADPLLHLVRNAVDHGLEHPDERRGAGKPPVGTVELTARQRGPEVVLALRHDGRGIDIERVLVEAGARGLDTAGLSPADAVSLVFTSGLSTAAAVTALSGRGVGLDVVSAVLRRVRGRVEVRSRRGEGTEFRLVVPLTLAVLPCLLAEAAGQRVAVPLQAVVTALPPASSPYGWDTVRVDGRMLPRCALAAALGLDPAPTPAAGGGAAALVLSDGARRHAFTVDRLAGTRDVVVRGLSPLLPRLPAVAGASVEPDGSILVVLDPGGLVDRAERLPGLADHTQSRQRPSNRTS